MKTLNFAFCALASFSFLGCTRPETGKTSLSFSTGFASGISAQASSSSLQHLAINVSSSSVGNPQVFIYDSSDETSLPASVTLDLNPGPGQLIQVIAVYRDSSGSSLFFYGDKTVTISTGSNTVQMSVTQLSAVGGTEGRVIGRYYLADGSTPTDVVEMLYNPGSGRPSMVVGTGEIIAGWFSLFGLDDLALSYRLQSTKTIMEFTTNWSAGSFTKVTSLKLSDFGSGGVNSSGSQFPGIGIIDFSALTNLYRTFSTSGPGTWEKLKPTKYIYGFHGNAPYTTAVVRLGVVSYVASFLKTLTVTDNPGPGCGYSANISDPNVSATSNAFIDGLTCQVAKAPLSSMMTYTQGASQTTNFTAFTNSADLEATGSFVDGQGNDNVAPFRGFLRKQYTGSTALRWDSVSLMSMTAFTAASFVNPMSLELVPGADQIITEVRVFKATSGSNSVRAGKSDSFDCSRAVRGDFGFHLIKSIPISVGTLAYPANSVQMESDDPSTDRALALCPYGAGGAALPGAQVLSTQQLFY